ncbi:MAG: tetratricopeptide repeat protein [Candidatus Puniceispirillaceae bacterium]
MNKSFISKAKYLIVIVTTTFWATSGNGYQPHRHDYIFQEFSSFDLTVTKKIEYSDSYTVSARKAYRNGSYLQAIRISRDVLSRRPDDAPALLVLIQSMVKLGVVGQAADAAIRYAEIHHPDSAYINKAISQLYLVQGNQQQASRYHSRSKRQFCPFNCQ